jgi:alpha-L-fucosidase
MIGLIFHWGLYSIPCYDNISSALNRRIQNGSEWYYQRLIEKGTFRPVSGFLETQAFHKETYNDRKYQDFATDFRFDSSKWNPETWMQTAVDFGAQYVILTAKHHDGFCLWNSKTTEYKVDRDLLKIFIESARKFGLKVGIYYSWMEFDKNVTIKYINMIVKPQIAELALYQPDIWWFDGDWKCTTKFAKSSINEIVVDLKRQNPMVEINDRIALEDKTNVNSLGSATYRVYGDREIPKEKPLVPWEHINTIGYSWGRNHDQQSHHYKTGSHLYDLYQSVCQKGGRLLLNLGPNSDGTLDRYEVESLKALKALVKDCQKTPNTKIEIKLKSIN